MLSLLILEDVYPEIGVMDVDDVSNNAVNGLLF